MKLLRRFFGGCGLGMLLLSQALAQTFPQRPIQMVVPVSAGGGTDVMARAVGLVGHILEESRNPMAEEIWHMVDEQATAHMRGDAA